MTPQPNERTHPIEDDEKDVAMQFSVDQPMDSEFWTAIARSIEHHGFDKVSVDIIASETGVSRATLYRKFGSRDDLLRAFLVDGSQQAYARNIAIVSGPGTISERLERVIISLIEEICNHEWLQPELKAGMSRESLNLFNSVNTRLGEVVLRPLLSSLIDEEDRFSGIHIRSVSDWLLTQILAFASQGPWEEARLRRHVRVFLLRVLLPDDGAPETDVSSSLKRLENKVDKLLLAKSDMSGTGD